MDDDPQGRAAHDEQRDDELLGRLRALGSRVDPVPAEALLAARSALAHLRLDAELAELTFDSHAEGALAGLRSSAPSARFVIFDAGAAQVELEVLRDGDRRRLVGRCIPATEVALRVRRQIPGAGPEVVTEVTTDDLGRFTVEVSPGTVSLRAEWPYGSLTVETSWLRV